MSYKFVQARNYTPTNGRKINKVVLHTAEMEEGFTSAESLAQYGATTYQDVSWHFATDNDSVVQCVRLKDIAWTAPGANHDGINIEICARASQTRAEWMRPSQQLDIVANLVADLCRTYNIPVRFLTAAQMAASPGIMGITTHNEVSKAWRRSDHTDPGSGFPMDWFLDTVNVKLAAGERLTRTPNQRRKRENVSVLVAPNGKPVQKTRGWKASKGMLRWLADPRNTVKPTTVVNIMWQGHTFTNNPLKAGQAGWTFTRNIQGVARSIYVRFADETLVERIRRYFTLRKD